MWICRRPSAGATSAGWIHRLRVNGGANGLRRLASGLVVGLALIGASAQAQDDSVWINQGIQAALASGQSSYTIPAGTYVLGNPIIIPPGTNNFTLAGAGSALTVLTAPNGVLPFPAYAILAGQQVLLNNWGLRNMETPHGVKSVVTGQTVIYLTGAGMPFQPGDHVVLLDSHSITSSLRPNPTQFNRAEVSVVTAVNSTSHSVTLDQPAAREYSDAPLMYKCNDLISTNLTFQGMAFDGTVLGSSNRNNGILNADLIDGLTLSDVLVTNYGDRAIQTDLVRNGMMTNLNLSNGSNIDAYGDGYGLTMCRSRFIAVSNSVATQTRHAFVCTNGSTDISFTGCTAPPIPVGINDFNTHGFDERRITYTNCVGTFDFGNPSWLGGGQGFVVNNCVCAQGFYFGPNTSNMLVENSSTTFVNFCNHWGSSGSPNQGCPNNITFQNCSIVGNYQQGIKIVQKLGIAHFQNCWIESTNGNTFQAATGLIGNLVFQNCTILNDDAPLTSFPFVIANAPNFRLNVFGCSVYSHSGAQSAVNLQVKTGNVNLSKNQFYSYLPAKPLYFVDHPWNAGFYVNTGNTCIKKTTWP